MYPTRVDSLDVSPGHDFDGKLNFELTFYTQKNGKDRKSSSGKEP